MAILAFVLISMGFSYYYVFKFKEVLYEIIRWMKKRLRIQKYTQKD